MKPTRVVVALAFACISVVMMGGAIVAAQTQPPPAFGPSASDEQQFGIVEDVVSEPASAAKVQGSTALGTARSYFGRFDQPYRLLHGRAAETPSQVDRAVWIVIFQGGDQPPGGQPIGVSAPPTIVDYTGAIVDDRTGEVLRAFRKGH